MKSFLFIIFVTLPLMAFASEEGGHAAASAEHHVSVMDLKWPFVNFFILFAFLVWKVKGPLSDFFTKNAENVLEIYESAEEKDKEAQIKLEMYQKKVNQIESEFQKVLEESKNEAQDFAEKHKEETNAILAKMRKDAEGKIEFEKKQIVKTMENSLVEDVITKAKEKIKSDSSLKEKATKKLLSSIN